MHENEGLRPGVEIGEEVDPARIAESATIHPGCRIRGAKTSIGPGCVVGAEAPATIENCQLGHNVALKGGYFSGAVFLDGANMGSGAHVRAGTILEEEANGAHTVGLKQTILLPFVTLGSLINFCDVFMAGGTSRKNHSEVGSSYIHFNYTPHQDKATASLVGDVPRGVFLDQRPIFLGGQGGLVGPARIEYGSVVAAGGICRRDIPEENQLHIPEVPKSGTRDYETGVYRNTDRIVASNLAYIGNILALREWYRKVRSLYVAQDNFSLCCLAGAMENLGLVLAERIKRLGDLAAKMEYSFQWLEAHGGNPETITMQKSFLARWPQMKERLEQPAPAQDSQSLESFLDGLPPEGDYLETIQSLEPAIRKAGRIWLQSIVDWTLSC